MQIQNYPIEAISDGDLVLGYRNGIPSQTFLFSGIQSSGTIGPMSTVVRLSSEDIQSMSSGISLLGALSNPAQYYDVQGVIVEFVSGDTPYVSDAPLELRGCFEAVLSETLVTDGDKVTICRSQTSNFTQSTNIGVGLTLTTDNSPTTGDGTIKVILFYTIRTLDE